MMIKNTLYFLAFLLLTGFSWLKYDNFEEGIKPYPRLADTVRIKSDLMAITQTARSRDYKNVDVLDTTAAYIHAEFLKTTAFFRNKNYHEKGDTLDRLNIGNIGLVVDGVFRALLKL